MSHTFTKENQKLEHLVESFLSENIIYNYPEYTEIIRLYFKYLDETYYKYIINWQDNANYLKIYSQELASSLYKRTVLPNEAEAIASEDPLYRITNTGDYREVVPRVRVEEDLFNDNDLLFYHYQTYFHNVIPREFFFLGDDEKRIYIMLSKMINSFKGNEKSFYALLKYLGRSKVVDDDESTILLEDFTLKISQNDNYWDIIRPTLSGNLVYEKPYTYDYKIETFIGLDSLFSLLKRIHPAGFDLNFGFPEWPIDEAPEVTLQMNTNNIVIEVFNIEPALYTGFFTFGGDINYNGIKTNTIYFSTT